MNGAGPEAEARRRIAALRPACVGVARVGELIGSTKRRVVFHAGPPFENAAEIPPPVRHSIAVAALRESWVSDFDGAERLLSAGAIETAAAQDHGLLVPLAGVLSPSTAVLAVRDLDGPSTVHVAINEGQRHATRLGLADLELPNHLRWLDDEFAPWLGERLATPLELAPVIAQALAEGDDCHARSAAGSRWIGRWLAEMAPPGPESAAALRFVDEAPAFALNFWMGAAALWLRAAEGVAGCSWISRAGGNGLRFGVQLAGRPGVWVQCPAPQPVGAIEAAHSGRSPAGALGDSAVVDSLGLGGQALRHAPAVREGLKDFLPADALERPARLLGGPGLARGLSASVVDARRCVDCGVGPLVLLGMIDAAGQGGRIGGGVVDLPVSLLQSALQGLAS